MRWGTVETIQEEKETSVSKPDAALVLSSPQFSDLAVMDEPNFWFAERRIIVNMTYGERSVCIREIHYIQIATGCSEE